MVQTKSRFLAYLGAASYSIYLCQEFSIPGFYKVSSSLVPNANGDLLAVLCLLGTAVLGCLIHEFLEKPLVKLCRKIPRRLPRLSNT
jgi:peptidoglycan/LPS O-acetylase OafA/YrhL